MGEKLCVRAVMTEEVLAVGPDTSVAVAAEQMISNGIRALPVTNENGEVLGIITDQHVMDYFLPAIKTLEEGESGVGGGLMPELETTTVRELMRRTVLCVREDQTLDEVAALMINKDIERFMVTAEGKLTGFITRGDILRRLVPPHRAGQKPAKMEKHVKSGEQGAENLEIRWEPDESDET